MATNWRLAKSIEVLLSQVNSLYPNRSKVGDGTIGDAAHASSLSDHNPNAQGVVTAVDITHDPANGLDIQTLADSLLTSRDARIKYIIANKQIAFSDTWTWRPYSGANPHTSHVHLSVQGDYDNTKEWSLSTMNQASAEQTVSWAYRTALNVDPTKDQAKYWVPRIKNDPNTVQELMQGLHKANQTFRYKAVNYDADVKAASGNPTVLNAGRYEVK